MNEGELVLSELKKCRIECIELSKENNILLYLLEFYKECAAQKVIPKTDAEDYLRAFRQGYSVLNLKGELFPIKDWIDFDIKTKYPFTVGN